MRLLRVAVLLAGPTALAFASGGFFDTARNVAGMVAWSLVVVLALFEGKLAPRRTSLLAIGGLAGLAAWTAVSLSWAPLVEPARDDVARLLLYLGALLASALAWGRREDARLIEPGLAAGAAIVAAYGLAGRLLPDLIDLNVSATAAGRLEQPLTYWNAMGALTGFGLTLAIRVAGDATRAPWLRASAAATSPLLGMAVYLSFSRGAIAALAAGVLVLLMLVPASAQLRAAALMLGAGVLAALAASFLPGVESLSGSSRGRDGAMALAALVSLGALAAFLQLRSARADRPNADIRLPRRAAVALLAVAALAGGPLLAVALDRGAGSERPAPGATASRLDDLGSNRYDYWDVAARMFVERPLEGQGASSFRVEWLRERHIDESVRDAHSLYLETAAELGLVGFALLALMIAGIAFAARAAVGRDRNLAAGWAAGVSVFAVHAAIDWDWEMPAVALPALVLAGALLRNADGSAS